MYVSQKVQDHAEQQKWSNSTCISFWHISNFEHCLYHKNQWLKLRVKSFHFMDMIHLFKAISFIDRNVKRQLSINMNHFNQRHFWVTNVLYITKCSSFIFSNNLMDCIIDFSFFILLNVINQNSNIDITIWQVQFCSKWTKILNTRLRVLFINHLFDS